MIKDRIVFTLYLLLIIGGCKSNAQKTDEVNVRWNKIINTQNNVSFIQVDSAENGYIISYAHSTVISGGFKIIEAKINNGKTHTKVLLEHPNHTIQWVKVRDNTIGFVCFDFDKNTLNSTLVKSTDLGNHWDTMQVPLQVIRRFDFLPSYIVVEGTLDGSTYIYRYNNKVEWSEINAAKFGYKDIYLLHRNTNEDKMFCVVDKTYNNRAGKLALVNIEHSTIKELLKIGSENVYLTPICKNENLCAIIDDKKISIYSYKKELLTLEQKFNIPKGVEAVKNLYMDESIYFITCEEKGMQGKELSWISYNKGADWIPFKQEIELKLVFNGLGELWAINNNNDLLKGSFFSE